MTARPWPDGTRPTPAQLLGWLRDTHTDQADALAALDRLLDATERASRCIMLDHDNLGRELDHMRRNLYTELITANRYRLAWRNARRRALRATYRERAALLRAAAQTQAEARRHDH